MLRRKPSRWCWALLACTGIGSVQAAETRYISEQLNAYLHGGPGDEYRIVGSVNAGDQVTLLEINAQRQFAQIQDAKGRTAWIPLQKLTRQPGLKARVPLLEQQIEQLTSKLQGSHTDWQQRTADLQQKVVASERRCNSFQHDNHQLKQQIAELNQRATVLQQQLDQQRRQALLQWFGYGGAVAGAGMLLGFILPILAVRRHRRARWMN